MIFWFLFGYYIVINLNKNDGVDYVVVVIGSFVNFLVNFLIYFYCNRGFCEVLKIIFIVNIYCFFQNRVFVL